MIRKLLEIASRRWNIKVEKLRVRPQWLGENDRFSYQSASVKFDIQPQERVLDVGGGVNPFPHATIIVDRFLESTIHRGETIVRDGRPVIVADISDLPFQDGRFDYVYCSHVLEHVEDPIKACSELMRVGKRGFIETPTYAKDMLFAWAEEMHKWHVVAISDILAFFEYSPRQEVGIRSTVWRDIIFHRHYHPLQAAFYENQDIFNTMLCWSDHFKVVVFRLDGSMVTAGM